WYHGSRLCSLRLPFHSHASGGVFAIAGVSEGFHGSCRRPRVLPGAGAHFVPPFGVFPLADPGFLRNRQSRPPVLMHSSNRYPLGNCDSLELETFSSYLSRLGAVSNRSWSHSPFFAFTDDARTSPEELVNPASAGHTFIRLERGGANQPGLTWPQSP